MGIKRERTELGELFLFAMAFLLFFLTFLYFFIDIIYYYIIIIIIISFVLQ